MVAYIGKPEFPAQTPSTWRFKEIYIDGDTIDEAYLLHMHQYWIYQAVDRFELMYRGARISTGSGCQRRGTPARISTGSGRERVKEVSSLKYTAPVY